MATGAGDEYWDERRLPSVFKHDLLRRYLPIYSGKTGSRSQGKAFVYLDGYAGRGRYEDGAPGSPEEIMRVAEYQRRLGINHRLFFYEKDRKSFDALTVVVNEYQERGVRAIAAREDMIRGLDDVLQAAAGVPLFLFLDPCGIGLPFPVLTRALTGSRAPVWPPTEVLLNFSLEAVRRIGGLVTAANIPEASLTRLDESLGGDWWREYFEHGVTDEAVGFVVAGFVDRMERATRMRIQTIPVRRAPTHKPVYHLVFGTRSPLGIWHFGDAVARATETWWNTLDVQESERQDAAGQSALFTVTEMVRPRLEDVETEAIGKIADNIARLMAQRGSFRIGDLPEEVFGDYYGRVREATVRAAVKELYRSGLTSNRGTGSRIADLVAIPPA
jgi:three-Cys-motif partner protein